MRNTCLISCLLSSLLVSVGLSGCGFGLSAPEPLVPGANAAALGGAVYGGQQPITGAAIYMYAASTAGYGGASTSLVLPYTCTAGPGCYPSTEDGNGNYFLTTDSHGNFSFAASEYACTPGQEVYIYSLGGISTTGGSNNSQAGLLAILGDCQAGGSFPGVTRIQISEVSTVAAAYAIAGYSTDATDVSNDATDANHTANPALAALATTGMANAFANAANIYNISTGGGSGALASTPSGGAVPQAEINTIADSLASCINSSGGGAGCSTLFTNVRAGGYKRGATATDTATVAINIAHFAGDANITSTVYINAGSSPPFAPVLTSMPNDLSVAIAYPVGANTSTYQVAIDGAGNAWIVGDAKSGSGKNATYNGAAVELSPSGAVINTVGAGGLTTDFLIDAVDASNNVWIGDGNGDLLEASGSNSEDYSGVVGLAGGIAFDKQGHVWVTDSSNEGVDEFDTMGDLLEGPTQDANFSTPMGIAIDQNNNVFVGDDGSGVVTQLDNTDTVLSDYTTYYASATISGLALDGTGSVWATDSTNSCFFHLTNANIPYNGTGNDACYAGRRTVTPSSVAIDGLGYVLIANSDGSVERFHIPVGTSNNSPVSVSPNGYNSSLTSTTSIAVDGSGDVWVTSGPAGTAGVVLSVTEFIGLTAPASTPILPNYINGTTLDTRP